MGEKTVSFRKLIVQALPEFWAFQAVIGIITLIAGELIRWLVGIVLHTKVAAITSSNIKDVLLSWQIVVIAILGIILVLIFAALEIFAQIYFADNILKGNQQKLHTAIFKAIGKGLKAIPKLLTPFGLLVYLYLIVAFPLIGLGFFSLTRNFRIPRFITDVIAQKPALLTLYYVFLAILVVIGVLFIFTLHGVLIGNKKPAEAAAASVRMIVKNKKTFAKGVLIMLCIIAAIIVVSYFIFISIPQLLLAQAGVTMPRNYFVGLTSGALSEMDRKVIAYRILCMFTIYEGVLLFSVVQLLVLSYLILRFGRFYQAFADGSEDIKTFAPRERKHKYLLMIIELIAASLIVAAFCVAGGLLFDRIVAMQGNPNIVAHRTGGTMESENSVEGIERSIKEGIFGGETDIQRTKDGYYVINHDKTFKRLTGVKKAPQDMTLEEIKKLRIKDTTGSGALLPVPTLEDLLDACGEDFTLFIEFKGPTADKQMVDDTVRLLKEKYSKNKVVLISLKYSVIDYAEKTYPEFDTGLLIVGGLGTLEDMNCDYLLVEEDMITADRVNSIHDAGKKIGAWTVNHRGDMERVIPYGIDAIITDEVLLAKEVSQELDELSDLERIDRWRDMR